MKSYAYLAAVPFVATAVSAAAGLVDMSKFAVKIASQAADFSGDYYVQNAKTGQYMYFVKGSDYLVDLVMGDDKTVLKLGKDTASGDKGGVDGTTTQTWSGTYIMDDTHRCISAQWGFDVGYDLAAVSYNCAVGPQSSYGSDTLEVAKQFWHFVPCGSSSSSSSTSASASVSASAGVQLNAKVASADSASTAKFVSNHASSAAASATKTAEEAIDTASSTSSSSGVAPSNGAGQCDKTGWWLATHTDYAKSSSVCKAYLDAYLQINPDAASLPDQVDSQDSSTWLCKHPGWWLARHSTYITDANHPECQDDLDAYYASASSSSRLARRNVRHRRRAHRRSLGFSAAEKPSTLQKRDETTYCIVAVDHLDDMTTRAITPNFISTAGGYKSLKLGDYDATSEEQQWIITAA
ncbi:hypothetical protein JCM10207_004154 [Rhodosporidiobolus poonsookiae]